MKKFRKYAALGIVLSSILVVAGAYLKIMSQGEEGNTLLLVSLALSAISWTGFVLSFFVAERKSAA